MTRTRKLNPAKFDRCVKDVKKRGGAANAYAVCTAAGTRNPGIKDPALKGQTAGTRRNPSEYESAVDASEDFHGTEAHELIEVKTEVFEHDNLADLGELISMDILSVNGGTVHLRGFEGARLAAAPKGYPFQLFIEGGDQSVDLAEFDIENPHELEVLGELKRIKYYTIKHHLGKDGGEANYVHKLGENGGKRPTVTYDSVNKLLGIVGGDYTILPEGIDN